MSSFLALLSDNLWGFTAGVFFFFVFYLVLQDFVEYDTFYILADFLSWAYFLTLSK